jgi:cation diffusion facilitator family transporter
MDVIFKTPRSAAVLSILSNTLLVGGKISIGLFTGSVSVLSEGIHSSLDLIAAVIAFISVTISGRPADKEHPYGHGKVENISGTIEAILIIVAGVLIIREAYHKIARGGEVAHLDVGLAIMLVSVVMNIFVSRVLFRVARRHESQALEADAQHLSTDVMTSGGVVLGLFLVRVTGLHWIDAVAAFGVAALIIYIGLKVLRTSFLDLIDQSLPEKEQKRIREIIELHKDQYVTYHKMRTRKSGKVRYIDMHLIFPRDISIQTAHDLCEDIEDHIRGEFHNVSITIHLEPHTSVPKN